MVNPTQISTQQIWKILEAVCDPEVPVLTILDLGIVRDVLIHHPSTQNELIEIVITPTYTGCPAMDMIAMNIKMILLENGYSKVKITSVLAPVWTTDWMTENGKQKLKEYGIAPPTGYKNGKEQTQNITCPLCNSSSVKLISQFGSTACKALYQCIDCKEPFDYFKCH